MFLLQAAATSINWVTIIASILGGGLISSIITFIASRNLKATDFRYDFRKYILQKRKEAYEQTIQTIMEISALCAKQFTDAVETSTSSEEGITQIFILFGKVEPNHIWLTQPIIWEIQKFRAPALRLFMGFDKTNHEVERSYNRQKHNVFQYFFSDMKTLSDVDTFIEQKLKWFENGTT